MTVKSVIFVLVLLLGGSLLYFAPTKERDGGYRASAGLAPDPASHPEAVVQVYAADTWGWRGRFAVHTWISVKRAGDNVYTVYDVVGWRQRWGRPVVGASQDVPDRHWFGAKPQLVADLRGEQAGKLIDKVEQAVNDYPWKDEYRVFPGPNSNTFIAWIGSQVPELDLSLPFSAIGSSYILWNRQNTPTGPAQ